MVDLEQTTDFYIIKLPRSTPMQNVQNVMDLIAYQQAIGESKATEEEGNQLIAEVKSGYWNSIKERFRGQEGFEEFFDQRKY